MMSWLFLIDIDTQAGFGLQPVSDIRLLHILFGPPPNDQPILKPVGLWIARARTAGTHNT